jgi:hypothetical protein
VFGGPNGGGVGGKSIFPGMGGGQDRIFYLAGNSIYYSPLKEGKDVQLSEKTFDGGEGDSRPYALAYSNTVTDDSGKKELFLDNTGHDEDDYSTDLYLGDLSKPDEDPKKIDSNILGYMTNISKDFKSVAYLSGSDENKNLYISDFEDRTKIDSDVSSFVANDDNSVIAYDIEDYGGSYIYKDGETSKLDTDSSIIGANKDLSVILLRKNQPEDDSDSEDVIYIVLNGGDKQKLASGESVSTYTIRDDGTFYFAVYENNNSMADFVQNDEGSDGSYKLDEYRDLDEYSNLTYSTYKLYYFNGKESLKIADEVYSTSIRDLYWDGYNNGPGKGCLTYDILDKASMPKLKLSEVYEDSDIYEWFYEEQKRNSKSFLTISGSDSISLGDGGVAANCCIDAEYNWMYYVFDKNEEGVGTLYKIKLDGSEPSKLDNDVSVIELVTPNGNAAYIKDVDAEGGDLYIDGKKIDSDVAPGSVMTFRAENYKNYYYLCDVSDYTSGTLKIVKGGNGEKVADDVYSYCPVGGGRVAVITDFRTSSYSGDLSIVKGGDETKIDTGVDNMLDVRSASDRDSPLYYGMGRSYNDYY